MDSASDVLANPERVAAASYQLNRVARSGLITRAPGPQPRWGWDARQSRHPRVAEYSNPGLWDATPSGFLLDHLMCALV